MSFGLFVVFAPPAGKEVSNHCGKNWSSRSLHDALGVGSHSRKTSWSCASVMLPPPYVVWMSFIAAIIRSRPRACQSAR